MKLLNTRTNTIWRYNGYYKRKISEKNRVFLQSEATKLEEFEGILLKREDQSAIGSHKFRPLSYQVACLLEDETDKCTISSSGNAAIALSHLPIESYIFISPNTPSAKKQQINLYNEESGLGARVFETPKAMRFSNYLSKKANLPQLRPSKDDNAIEGYKSLGFELFEQDPWIDAVFLFITSGASLLGVYEAYKTLLAEGCLKQMPALHAVFGTDLEDRPAGLCAPSKMRREKEVLQAIKSTYGAACSLTNQELKEAFNKLKNAGILTSYESCAAFVACQKGKAKYKNPAAVFSGKMWEEDKELEEAKFNTINTFEELDELLVKI